MKEATNNEINIASLEKEFSLENFEGYGQMCDRVAWEMAEAIMKKEGRITILLPSRGALPIFLGAMLALKRDRDLREFNLAQRIELPPLSCFDYVREKVAVDSQKGEGIEVLIFPFTSDINLRGLVESEQKEGEIVDDMRRFGARAVTGFLSPVEKRENFELELFLAFLEVVEKRQGITSFYRGLKQAESLVMIDTVISGRASFTIMDELEKEGVMIGQKGNLIPILVVDKNGEQLKSKYGRFLYGYPNHRIDVPRILSEDRGAALEGVVAVVYPDLIIAACKQGLCPDGYPLLGSWHDIPSEARERYLKVFNNFLMTIDAIVARKTFREERRDFCESLKESGVLRVGDAAVGEAELNLRGVNSIIETSAHVVQAGFPPRNCRRLIRGIKEKLGK